MPPATPEALTERTAAIFRACGASDEDATFVAHALVDAERAGHESHGLIRVSEYVREIRSGVISPKASPEILHDSGSGFLVDGNWGFGQVVARWTTERLIERAREHGIASAGIRNSAHVGRVGVYPEMAACEGLVSFAFVNGGGTEARVAPFGGSRAVFGTNPMAAAVPMPGAPPIVLDFSTAVVASGKIRVLRDRREPLPEGWILDRTGKPSTSAADYYDGGMLLPFAGHKGYALCLLIELLAGCLTGAGSIALPESGYRVGNGMFILAFDPSGFGDADAFLRSVGALATAVKETPPAEGFDRVMLPGDPEREAGRARTLDVSDTTMRLLDALAAELGVEA